MTDQLLHRLAQANPVPQAAVADLNASLRRQSLVLFPVSAERASRGRVAAIAAVLAIAALVVGPALALRFGVIDFSSAEPASPHVVTQFSSLSEDAPAGMDPRVVAGEARLVGEIGGHTLWVAPTKPGGLCFGWSKGSGGCDKLGTVPLSVSWSSDAPFATTSGPSFLAVSGFARARWADDVEITLDDGFLVHPEVIWISPPIDAGFFYYRAPDGRTIAKVASVKGHKVMAADTGNPSNEAHPLADLSQRTQVAEFQTNDGPATFWTAPTPTEGRCTWLEFQNTETPIVPCLPAGYEHQAALSYAVHSLGGHLILAGECGYSAIEFLHLDSGTRRVQCSDGLVFTELNPADAAGQLRALDSRGRPLSWSAGSVPPPTDQR